MYLDVGQWGLLKAAAGELGIWCLFCLAGDTPDGGST